VTNTYFADVSEYQPPVDDTYPHPVLSFRSNDGTYRDGVFAQNHAWARAAADSGRLSCFIVYLVYRTNWQQTLDTLKAQVGTPHPKMAVMIDVESWGGQITGDQSNSVNALRDGIGAWLGSTTRVCAYGNQGDLAGLYPSRPADLRLVVAGYGQDVTGYPGQFAQQYTDAGPCAPFGTCDMNIARGMTPADVAAALGIGIGDTSMSAQEVAQIMARIEQVVAWEDSNFKALQAQSDHNRDLLAGFTRDTVNGAVKTIPAPAAGGAAAPSPVAVVDELAARLAPKAGA